MKLRTKVERILDSDLSAYQIAKNTGVVQPKISNLRNGKTKIDNLTLEVAEELGRYYDQLKKTKKIQ